MNNNFTELPKSDFKWDEGLLLQRIEVIQHYKVGNKDVGIYQEWHPVVVDGQLVIDKKPLDAPTKSDMINECVRIFNTWSPFEQQAATEFIETNFRKH